MGDTEMLEAIRQRRAKMYFPSSIATKEWADIDYLLTRLEEAEKERDDLQSKLATLMYGKSNVLRDRDEVGLNLLRQLVGGKNALREFDVFACNDVNHDLDCKCFWEQCEAWAIDMGQKEGDGDQATASRS